MRAQFEALVPSPFMRFVLTGGAAALANIFSRIVLSQVMAYEVAIVLAYLTGMTVAYLLMKLFVFEASNASVSVEYIRFSLVNFLALMQVWIVSVGFARWFLPAIGFMWHVDTVAHIFGVLSPVATSYVGHKSFTFARKNEQET